jgi:hypothetical protein
VLTTYSIVESEYRRCIAPAKVECQYCGSKFYPRQLITHLKFFCGPDAQKSAAQAAQHKKKTRKGSKKMQGKQKKLMTEDEYQQREAKGRAKDDGSDDSDFSALDDSGGESDGGAPAEHSSRVAAHGATAGVAEREDAEQAAERARGGVLHAVQWYRLCPTMLCVSS